MYGLKAMLLEEQKHLEEILKKTSNQLVHAPEGNLRISVDNGKARYYCIKGKSETYISKKESGLAENLANKSYLTSVTKKAEVKLKQIKRLLYNYSDNEIEEIYESLHHERQKLISPIEPTYHQLLENWLNEPYAKKSFQEGTTVILSNRGERVRSKSEKILADYFDSVGVSYLYEKPLYLKGYGVVYPDFTFYSKKLRNEIYWEHEGMMDKPEYAETAIKKINTYIENGIYPGERLILTYETEQDVLSTNIVRAMVKKYLL